MFSGNKKNRNKKLPLADFYSGEISGEMMDDISEILEQVYDECSNQLYACALSVTGCPDMAEDAVSKAFCRMLEFTTLPGNVKGYLFRCVRNASIDLLRKRHESTDIDNFDIFDSKISPREFAANNEFLTRISKELAALSEDERETIIQHLWGEMKFREIAEMREIAVATVTSWYRRGLEKLKISMEQDNGKF